MHGGLNGRTLGSDNNYLFIVIIKCRSDPPGIAHGKNISMPHHSGHGIPPIPMLAGSFKYFCNIQSVTNLIGNVQVGISLGFKLVK